MLKKWIVIYVLLTNGVFFLSIWSNLSNWIASILLVVLTISFIILVEIASKKGKLNDIE
ncbi:MULTISPECIES: hypothetical protein [Pontibacillus]|uniref:Uncharacterized protein n=1 Tax=Pontibacillus chungwhensis TaxID=265426 RepID=A0ABY8UVN9_9BACI|nr:MULTISPECIES: hypothetical protein [Pontibacillus]MCD5323182.1 hypothetical protein [Pontibacillus sp. HN14]WIF96569.1 hypothetical protein QNI29_12490 [Pontibacillus chungwhensis]